MRKIPYVLALVGIVLLGFGLLSATGTRSADRALQAALIHDAETEAAAFTAYLDRARGLNLLLSQNPAFSTDLASPRQLDAANDALEYLEVLYPEAIGEACIIDDQGHELARVVDRETASHHDLSHEEAANAFFAKTLDRPFGEVYQSPPYVSPDTHTWVISNSTWVPRPGGSRLIVHFEVTLESFRPYVQPTVGGHGALVDESTGAVIMQDGVSLPAHTFPVTAWSQLLPGSVEEHGAMSVNGRMGAFQRVDRSSGGAPDWYAVVWSTQSAGGLPTWAGGAFAALGAALVLLSLWLFRRQHSAMRAAARVDRLTGLANREGLEEALNAALHNSAHAAHPGPGVLIIDLDGFKQINDSLGHDSGDMVLQEVARRLFANILEQDTAARLGGDEFAVVLSHLHRPEDVAAVAARVRDALVRPFEVGGVYRFIGASVGASTYPAHGRTGLELLRSADSAMYQAKRARDGVRVYDPGTLEGVTALGLAADLLLAIEDEQIMLAFQPEFSPRGDRIQAVEALARWTTSYGQAVPPSQFVPLAEETGLIRALTLSTLRQALDAARSWRETGVHIPVSVNLSGAVVGDRDLPAAIQALLDERDLPPGALNLEVTETAFIRDRGAALDVLGGLRDGGVRIELDDFGTGYASFTAVRDLPLDAVKIDRALVAAQVGGDAKFLAAVVELAHSLDLDVIAEGIEDAPTLDVVRRLGCDGVQGYHLARPMTAAKLTELLRTQPWLVAPNLLPTGTT